MALTLNSLMRVGRHALDNGDPSVAFGTDAGDTLREYVNQAGRQMFNCHAWNWRRRRSTTLDFTADVNYVALPADFGEMISCTASADSNGFAFATIDEIDGFRSGVQIFSDGYRGAIAWPGQTSSASQAGVPVLELAPTPSATAAGALTINYREGWIDLVQESDTANVRPAAELLLCEFVRAVCRGSEDGDIGARIANVEGGPIYAALVRLDGMQQPNYGPTMGGAAAMSAAGNVWGRTSVVPNPT